MGSLTGCEGETPRVQSLRARLRAATEWHHRKVEQHLRLDRPMWTMAAYAAVLQKLWGIYVPLENQLTQIDWADWDLDIQSRVKVPWLVSDLSFVGLNPSALSRLDQCRDAPLLPTAAHGLGALYVLEGATLGGQVILSRLQRDLGVSASRGAAFYASYGKMIGPMWRSYLVTLERCSIENDIADVIEYGAIATFAAFERWFCCLETQIADAMVLGHV